MAFPCPNLKNQTLAKLPPDRFGFKTTLSNHGFCPNSDNTFRCLLLFEMLWGLIVSQSHKCFFHSRNRGRAVFIFILHLHCRAPLPPQKVWQLAIRFTLFGQFPGIRETKPRSAQDGAPWVMEPHFEGVGVTPVPSDKKCSCV